MTAVVETARIPAGRRERDPRRCRLPGTRPAGYLRAELAKPEDAALLRVPEIDAQQRPCEQ
jgi:hypothetical protein